MVPFAIKACSIISRQFEPFSNLFPEKFKNSPQTFFLTLRIIDKKFWQCRKDLERYKRLNLLFE